MFEGFSQEALDFLNDIRFNNNQAFYAANQARYERFVSDRIMPVAEQKVSDGDCEGLSEIVSTGMVSDADLRRLLERSLRSGRTSVTSLLMSEIRRRAVKNER